MKETNKKGYAIASAILLAFGVWFCGLGVYLYVGIKNYEPPPNAPADGDMIIPLIMFLMFLVGGILLFCSLWSLLIFLARRSTIRKTK